MQYFESLTDEKEIKQRYKELAKQYHPDRGGDAEIMKQINTQYEKVMTGVYQTAGKSITEIDELFKQDIKMREKLNAILGLEDLIIEICGTWIWVTGDTKAHKDTLKSHGYLWASKKSAWFFRSEHNKTYGNRFVRTMDEIRYRHGTLSVVNKPRVAICA